MTLAAVPALLAAPPTVTWIKVEKPVFDLVGVVLYSLGLAGLCALVALVLGAALGFALIARTRKLESQRPYDGALQLIELRRS